MWSAMSELKRLRRKYLQCTIWGSIDARGYKEGKNKKRKHEAPRIFTALAQHSIHEDMHVTSHSVAKPRQPHHKPNHQRDQPKERNQEPRVPPNSLESLLRGSLKRELLTAANSLMLNLRLSFDELLMLRLGFGLGFHVLMYFGVHGRCGRGGRYWWFCCW